MSGERIETAGEVVAQARICPSCHDDHYEPGWLAQHDAAVTAQADAEVRRLTAALAEAEALLDKPLDPDDPCAEHDDHIWTDLALDRLAALRAILARTEQMGADR